MEKHLHRVTCVVTEKLLLPIKKKVLVRSCIAGQLQ